MNIFLTQQREEQVRDTGGRLCYINGHGIAEDGVTEFGG